MNAIEAMPIHTISAWSENGRPRRAWATTQPTNAAARMASPPIVGVPCLAMWCSGPWSSLPRIGWPSPRVPNAVMRSRVMTSDSTPATTPAIMTAITFGAPAVGGRRHGRRTARPAHRSSASSHGPCRRRRRRRPGSPTRVPARWPPLDPPRPRPSCGPLAAMPATTASMIAARSLRPRVVRRHDHAIGQPRRNRTHLWPLAWIPITAAPEHDEDGAVGDLAGRAEELRQPVGRVGVVDDHGRHVRRGRRRRVRSVPARRARRPAPRRSRRARCRASPLSSPRRRSSSR